VHPEQGQPCNKGELNATCKLNTTHVLAKRVDGCSTATGQGLLDGMAGFVLSYRGMAYAYGLHRITGIDCDSYTTMSRSTRSSFFDNGKSKQHSHTNFSLNRFKIQMRFFVLSYCTQYTSTILTNQPRISDHVGICGGSNNNIFNECGCFGLFCDHNS
jgi:hypothetical protein